MDEQWDGVAAARLHRQGLWAPTAADAPAVLDALVATLEVEPVIENTVWESLCLANAMTAMAANHHTSWL